MWLTFGFSVKILEKFWKLSFGEVFLRHNAKNRSFCRMGAVIFCQNFGKLLKGLLSAEPSRCQFVSSAGRSASWADKEPEKTLADKEPSARTHFLASLSAFQTLLTKTFFLASVCGGNESFRKNGAPYQLMKRQKMGAVSSHQDIYMLWIYYLGQVWPFQMLLSGPSRCYYFGPSLFLTYFYSGFRRFLCSAIIVRFLMCPIICQFSENNLFSKKRVQKLGFANFTILSSFFEISLFLGLLKHYKNRGFSREEKNPQKNDNWNFRIWFFCPKMAVSWRITVFQKLVCWNPCFYGVWGCAFAGPSCQKMEFLDTPPKKKILTDNWKVFLYFLLSLVIFPFFFPFFFSLLLIKKLFSPLKRAFFAYFWVSPFVSP